MKFECSGSKGTRVIERKRSVTDGQTARQPDSQTDRRTRQKQYVSPRGGRHNTYILSVNTCIFTVLSCLTLVEWYDLTMGFILLSFSSFGNL